MAQDLTQNITSVSDEVTFSQGGQPVTNKKVTFFLGTHGPFTERFPADQFTAAAVQQRINAIKAQLQLLTT